MMRPIRGWSLFATGMLVLCAATVACAASAMDDDSRLATQLTVKADDVSVNCVLMQLSSQLGVALKADPPIADMRISAGLAPRPAGEALNLLADLLLAEWVPDVTGYRLTLSKLGRQAEAEIVAKRDWTVTDRLKQVKAGLEIPADAWREALKDLPSHPLFAPKSGSDAGLLAGFEYPGDTQIATSLTSPYRRALYQLVIGLPATTWEAAKDPAGVSFPLRSIPDADRQALADILTGETPMWPGSNTATFRESWPKGDDKLKTITALRSDKGHMRLKLRPDRLGRWDTFIVTVPDPSSSHLQGTIELEFPMDHTFWNVIMIGKHGRPGSLSRRSVLPGADDSEAMDADDSLYETVGSFQWPPTTGKHGRSTRDDVLSQLGERLGIEYLATRCEDRREFSNSIGSQSRIGMIDSTASALDATWERERGVYLFRERDWPLKRDRRIPDAWFARWSAKLSPEGYLSLDDLATAAAELTPKQKYWWMDNATGLPLKGYMRLLTCNTDGALDLWRQLTPDQKKRMKITYDPDHKSDPYENGAGISINELDPALRQQLIERLTLENRIHKEGYDDIRIGWMHYRVQDGFERDRLDYEILSSDGRSGACFFELFHPKPGE